MEEDENELREILYYAKPFAEPIDECLLPENLELNHCVKCGKGVPHYCEKCHQDLIGENARLQYHLTKIIPTEENEVRLHNIIDHFERIKHTQQTVEINAEDIKAIQELIATKKFLKHKWETYFNLYWNESVANATIEEKIEDLKANNNGDDYSLTNVIMILQELLDGKEEEDE